MDRDERRSAGRATCRRSPKRLPSENLTFSAFRGSKAQTQLEASRLTFLASVRRPAPRVFFPDLVISVPPTPPSSVPDPMSPSSVRLWRGVATLASRSTHSVSPAASPSLYPPPVASPRPAPLLPANPVCRVCPSPPAMPSPPRWPPRPSSPRAPPTRALRATAR